MKSTSHEAIRKPLIPSSFIRLARPFAIKNGIHYSKSNSMDELRARFQSADVNHSGKLSSHELKRVLDSDFGSEIPKERFDEFLRDLDLNDDQEWSIDELVQIFSS
uniref:EF-hand domain-containing protein n=1 Tax=Trichobilharzia regenti TaxID=157069 RepID=A0AA85IYY1_TRIRE|nr:unnamed protein product [Trichobilharzia regenti]